MFFSPVQTRKQRLLNGVAVKKTNIKMEPLSPARVAPKKFRKDDRMVTRVQMGSATVVICKVVPDAVDSPVRVDKVKEEVEPQIKQEAPEDSHSFSEVQAPHPLWFNHLENIRIMRNSRTAPVDTMGCHRCADLKADSKVFPISGIKYIEEYVTSKQLPCRPSASKT